MRKGLKKMSGFELKPIIAKALTWVMNCTTVTALPQVFLQMPWWSGWLKWIFQRPN